MYDIDKHDDSSRHDRDISIESYDNHIDIVDSRYQQSHNITRVYEKMNRDMRMKIDSSNTPIDRTIHTIDSNSVYNDNNMVGGEKGKRLNRLASIELNRCKKVIDRLDSMIYESNSSISSYNDIQSHDNKIKNRIFYKTITNINKH